MSKGHLANSDNATILAVQHALCRLTERMNTNGPNWIMRVELNSNKWITINVTRIDTGFHHANTTISWETLGRDGFEQAEAALDALFASLEGPRYA